MTPSEKLDDILKTGRTPTIAEVVDVDTYKYVWRVHGGIRCGDWRIDIPYGFLSDGASCVPDRVMFAWFAHDRLYLSPWGWYRNVRNRVSKVAADLIYARLSMQRSNLISALHGIALATGINRRVWRRYREQDEATLVQEHTVPRAACWSFPTQYTRDAVWDGVTTD